MDNMKAHLKNIIDANNNNRLAVFVGTGVSMTSNTETNKIPSWGELIDELKSDLSSELKENDYLRIAQLFYLEFGPVTYLARIKKYFPETFKPSIIHELIFEIEPEYIITTNWDTLLEQANNGIYGVIHSDIDLVKSTSKKKIIKMHGDFTNDNIVFKEDDYLGYEYNFPLIENYIKSILSTHTVVFLGYSYSDINLKHIVNWLKNHSEIQPPKYLFSSKDEKSQRQYLANHGIKTLILESKDDSYNTLKNDKSEYMASFLKRISSFQYYENSEELQDIEILIIIYDKLSHLSSLNYILSDQIKEIFSNCRFSYYNLKFRILI